jgi:hypothetical protein
MSQGQDAVRELLIKLIREGSQESFQALRAQFVQTSFFDPYNDHLTPMAELVRAGELAQAKERWEQDKMHLLLSPTAHLYAARIMEGLGDQRGAEMETYLAHLCMRGILESGDGTRERPYLVTCIADQHDVMGSMQAKSTFQSLEEDGDRRLDRHLLEGGGELWFDVTEQFIYLSTRFATSGVPPHKPS